MELYKVCINHDPGVTLTYFMARSAYSAYPRSQVSIYRTIGPLVIDLVAKHKPGKLCCPTAALMIKVASRASC